MPKLATAALLTQVCDIYERSDTRAGKQPVVPTPEARGTGIKCRLWPISSKEQSTLVGRMIQATHRIIMRTENTPPGFGPEWQVIVGSTCYQVQEASDVGGIGEVTQALLVVVQS